jgi:glucose/arabinose dehydrogenase
MAHDEGAPVSSRQRYAMKHSWHVAISVSLVLAVVVVGHAQRGRPAALGAGPWIYKTADADFRVSIVATGLAHPWSIAFLPDGDILVTERAGRLRLIHNGVLDPTPVAGVPAVYANRLDGLMDLALHPNFAQNKLVYFSYSKPGPELKPGAETLASRLPANLAQRGATGKTKTDAVARGRWDGHALVDVKDVFVADNWVDDSVATSSAVRLVFGRDGMLYMGLGAPNAPAAAGKYAHSRGGRAQDPGSDGGKFLRLRDDGTIPSDNPFVGKPGYRPEIYSLGHRNAIGLAVHPVTGAIWESENGPADDDEMNVLKPGANYGWPLVGFGRDYSGDFIGGAGAIGDAAGRPDASTMYLPGMEPPVLFWSPTVAPAGITFYNGDRFPKWKGSLFVGIMKSQRLERIALNDKGWVKRREWLLDDLKQRVRDVRQSPDGLLYVLTDEDAGAVLRLEPLPQPQVK